MSAKLLLIFVIVFTGMSLFAQSSETKQEFISDSGFFAGEILKDTNHTSGNKIQYYHCLGTFSGFGSDYVGAGFAGFGLNYMYRSFHKISLLRGLEIAYSESSNIDDIGTQPGVFVNGSAGANLQFLKSAHLRLLGHGMIVTDFKSGVAVLPGVTLGTGVTFWRLETALDIGIKGMMPYAQIGMDYVFSDNKKLFLP